jgi:broad specificity polyphosphatase/5'/3'-nucleotidase SurE
MADEVIEMHLLITASDGFKAYAIRDQYLVDVASSVVAFYNPARRKSGTGMTVSLAEKRAIPVRIVRVKSV